MYFAPINDGLRRNYIYEMMNNGVYLNGNGEEVKIDTAKYGELVPREKMSIGLFFKEVDYEKYNIKDRTEKLAEYLKKQAKTYHSEFLINGDNMLLVTAELSLEINETALGRFFEENGL